MSGDLITWLSKSPRATKFAMVITMRARTMDFPSIRASLNITVGSGLICVNVNVARPPVTETLNCPSHTVSGTLLGSIASGCCCD